MEPISPEENDITHFSFSILDTAFKILQYQFRQHFHKKIQFKISTKGFKNRILKSAA